MNNHIAFHGSDLEKISDYYQLEQDKIINFAANVNPLGVSKKLQNYLSQNLDIISEYPDRNYVNLRNILATYCSTSADNIIVGNGSTELISLLISNIHAKKALLLGPTYSEYERELQLIDCTLEEFRLSASTDFQLHTKSLFETLDHGFDFLILCNPNNPTGNALNTSQLREILAYCLTRNIFMMIDETYIEFASDINTHSAISLTHTYPNLMVLRGVSKFFAAPGLRMGYGITGNMDVLAHLKHHQNPWSLNSIATLAGAYMFQDSDYITSTHTLIHQERKKCHSKLNALCYYKAFRTEANFMLVQLCHANMSANDFFVYCIKQGFMIRNCDSFFQSDGEFVRFCFMLPEDNDRLLECFTSYHSTCVSTKESTL